LTLARALELPPELTANYRKLVEDRAGLRVSSQQARGLRPAVELALREANQDDPWALFERLKAGLQPDLLDSIASSLTVGETHFLRVLPQMDALQRVVLPALVALRAEERRLRLWSAGCSTGEEPYTLAIVLRDALPNLSSWNVNLVASDISQDALRRAREGLYGQWSFRGTPSAFRDQHFEPEGDRWRVIPPIRRMVEFVPFNLTKPSYPASLLGPPFDLIVCRNVTIYFTPALSQAVYARFRDRLAPGGWLILGPSDPAPDESLDYETISAPGALLWRRPAEPKPGERTASPVSATTHERGIGARIDDAVRPILEISSTRPSSPTFPATTPLAPEPAKQLRLGLAQLDEGEPELALQSLRRATFMDSTDAFAQFMLGRAYVRAGERALAGSAFSHALRLLQHQHDGDSVAGTDLNVGELRHAGGLELAATATSAPIRRR
jgi:chemotaxis protein methyltransferase CheR